MVFEPDAKEINPTEELKADERLDKYKTDIVNDADHLSDQRDQANTDIRFINVPGGMWEDFLEDQFSRRTKLEFDLTSGSVNKAKGEWNENRVGVIYKPNDDKTSDDEAELLNGIYRADFRDESGKLSVDNAVDEVFTCGYGCFKIGTKFVDLEDPKNEDQRPDWRPINNAFNSIYWDRSAKRIDKRDARWCTELEEYTRDSFLEQWPDEEPISAYEPEQLRFDTGTRRNSSTIHIASRYEIVIKKETTFVYGNLATNELEFYSEEDHELIKDDLRKDKTRRKFRERETLRQKVMKSVFNGEKFLEKPRQIPGKFIPIIPIYAYHAFVNGTEYYHGLVRKLIDPQRSHNMLMSQVMENSASSGTEVPILTPDQVEGHESNWADRSKAYQLINPTLGADGNVIGVGPVSYLKPPQLDGATAALLQVVPQHMQAVTGGAPQDTLDPHASGKALNALLKRENMKTQLIFDNIANSIERSGEVYQAIAADVFNSKRVVKTLGIDGTDKKVQLFKEVQDEETGRIITINTFRGKKFKAYSDVGPQYESSREQMVEDIKGMIELLIQTGPAGQKYVPLLTSMMLQNMSGVGLSELKALVRKDMIIQGLQKPETDEEKQMVAELNQPKEDPQAKLAESLSRQAEAEGVKFEAEARQSDSKSIVNIADARKKLAETRKLLSDAGINEKQSLNTILNDSFKRNEERAKSLPF